MSCRGLILAMIVAAVAWGSVYAEDAVSVENAAVDAAGFHHESTGAKIARVLRKSGLPDEVVVALISTLPIVELRGAVPVGHMMGMNPWIVYGLAVAGNMIPIPLILLFLGPISRFLMKFKLGRLFFDWLFARTRKKTADIEKYETLGLTIFVAIPLPVTGGWTGAMAAFLMGVEFRHAMLSILLGVMIAGVIMTVLSLLGWLGAIIAGVVLIGLAAGAVLGVFRKEEQGPYGEEQAQSR
ncbi:MAG: small multi-drug export protein [Verrucomicrobia bacterium]|nr:small multi-drug export protein [Verrucomicrobiota bacterium]